jgi:hypothetical protein
VILQGGVNDYLAGQSVAQVQALITTFVQARLAAHPLAWVLLLTGPPCVAPHAQAATINPLVTAHNVMLRALAPTLGARVKCIEAGSLCSAAQVKPSDGLHLTGEGQAIVARAVADAIMRYVRPVCGPVAPRKIVRRTSRAYAVLAVDADKITLPTFAGLTDMGAGSFSLGIRARPTSLANANSNLLMTYNGDYQKDLILDVTSGGALSVYFSNATAQVISGDGVFAVNKWTQVVLAFDAAEQYAAIYCMREGSDGRAVTNCVMGYHFPAPKTILVGQTIVMGYNTITYMKTLPCAMADLWVAVGKACTPMEAEDWYYDNRTPQGVTGMYRLDDGSGTAIVAPPGFGQSNGTLTNGSWAAAASIASPWDFGGDS